MNSTAILFAFLSAVFMGTIGVFSKITGLPADIITFFRLGLGSLFMLVFLICAKRMRLLFQWPTFTVLINGGFLAGFIIFYVHSMNYTSMANAIMMIYLGPLAASVVAHFFLNERLNLLSAGLIGLALFGFAMMMEFKIELSLESAEFIGVCLGLLAMLCYAGFILVNRLIREEIHVYTRTFYQLLAGACIMLPLVLDSIGSIQTWQLPWLIGVGFIPGFMAILFAVIALSRLPAATFGTIAYIEPVAVVAFGWTIFQETLNLLQISGCLLIIACGIIKTVTASKAERPDTAAEKQPDQAVLS